MTDDDRAPEAPRPAGTGPTPDAESDRDHLGVPTDERRATLREVLTESRRLGFLGPGPIEDHVVHAMGFVPLVGAASDVLDLGSGGGLPGLVLMTEIDGPTFVLLDASTRRCEFLASAVERLGLADRATVVCGRAEELAHDPQLRGRFPVVVARSFGAPAVTAECAVGFLDVPGSRLLVSEPPDASDGSDASDGRWPPEGLASLGLRPGQRLHTGSSTIQVLELATVPPPTVPRRVGVPSKRPRF